MDTADSNEIVDNKGKYGISHRTVSGRERSSTKVILMGVFILEGEIVRESHIYTCR